MRPLARAVLAHRRIVVLFWLAVTLAGFATVGHTTKALKQKFSVPGREGWVTNLEIARLYHLTGGNGAPLLAVVSIPPQSSPSSAQVHDDLLALERRAQEALPGSRVASFASTGNSAFLAPDHHTTFVIIQPPADPTQAFGDNPRAVDRLSAALGGATVAGAPVRLTGIDVLNKQTGGGGGPGVLIETMIGALGALAVLAFVFASLLAFVPLVIALVSIMGTFMLVLALTTVTEVSPIVQFLVALIGLGVAIDYSLLIVVRWREERAHGREGDEAIVAAMETAGRAVVFSGTTVAIGLLALVALPLPFLRSVGYGGLLIPLVSVAVSITLLPIILSKFGHRLDWPHVRTDDRASRAWTAWAGGVIRLRWPAAGAALLVLVALIVAATELQPGTPNADTLTKQGAAHTALVSLERSGLGSGVLLPDEILVRGAPAGPVAQRVAAVSGMDGAVGPAAASWHSRGTSIVEAFPRPDSSTSAGRTVLDRVLAAVHTVPGASLGGIPEQNQNFIDAVYGNFPLMIALIAVVTFILLARAFRSLLLPLKAILLNVVSVAAAWGVITLVWQEGHGSEVWGIGATHSVTAWIPLMMFAFLFGLSMDYEVFILSRIREEYDTAGRTDDAVVVGIGRTGRLVTSAALILFLAFASLASGPETDIKVMATGLAAGILLDATVIRSLLVPALVSLFGRWNWWLPRWPARLLRVEPSLPVRAQSDAA